MHNCETCGNDYPRMIEIVRDGKSHFFDSFECAIAALAPECAHCGCRVIGHGVDIGNDQVCCCQHCAREMGAEQSNELTSVKPMGRGKPGSPRRP